MYYPILRGKQNELLALRDCADRIGATSIYPVIEPVRDLATGGGSLRRCLDSLLTAGAPVAVIINPSVGEYAADIQATRTLLSIIDELDPDNTGVAAGVNLDSGGNLDAVVDELVGKAPRPHVYVHTSGAVVPDQALSRLATLGSDATHLAAERSRVRRHPAFARPGARVAKLEDTFERADSNAAYRDCEPYQFTDWNVYYSDDGYVGYADFATIGATYSTSGFTPRAVAIHLTYLNRDDSTIWIQHFVSQADRNTMANVAAKFEEAVTKLVHFADNQGLDNPAIGEFRRLLEAGQFPGLGVIKRLSLINHLYVAGDPVV